jgi:LD-carboxypeptidase N-terminal domain
MTTIAIVNLANPSLKLTNPIKSKFDKLQNFIFMDYTGDESNYIEQFHQSLKDKNVDIIWFLSGGTNLIKAVKLINWNLVLQSKAIFVGSSDITHFFLFSPKVKNQMFYYFSNFVDFEPNLNDYSLLNMLTFFLKKNLSLDFQGKKVNLDLDTVNIVGGHSIISSLFVDKLTLSQTKENYYFWEHHGNFETVEMYQYWLEILNFNCQEMGIRNIILGKSFIYENNKKINFNEQYEIAKTILDQMIIRQIDQTEQPIALF